ncbi:MAG: hypothetical protein LBR88_11300 [Zoogloeaceae bacterium]|nr:hypothetical protein [Zoogloeaceae bacterium]
MRTIVCLPWNEHGRQSGKIRQETLFPGEQILAFVYDSNEFVKFFPGKSEEEKEKVRQARERNETPSPEDEVYADSAYVQHAEVLHARANR